MNPKIVLLAVIICTIAVFGLLYFLVTNKPGLPKQPANTPVVNTPTSTQAPSATESAQLEHPLIKIISPQPESKISSPLTITGLARGAWFFEATFPVVLTDWDGKIIAEGYAQAQGEWMTEEFVPFVAELIFEKPAISNRGSLILQKANPSGLPEQDDAFELTVFFE